MGTYRVVITNSYATVVSGKASLNLVELTGDPFQISALTTNHVSVQNSILTGDDRGGMALSTDRVFVTGDTATAGFALTDLSGYPRRVPFHPPERYPEIRGESIDEQEADARGISRRRSSLAAVRVRRHSRGGTPGSRQHRGALHREADHKPRRPRRHADRTRLE